MSSLVHAKWVSSATDESPSSASLRAHQVLDGLHVVTGRRLEPGELIDLGLVEPAHQFAELAGLLEVEPGGAEQLVIGQVEQPLDLDPHARAVESGLGEVLAQLAHRAAIASVERADGLFGQGAHETSL